MTGYQKQIWQAFVLRSMKTIFALSGRVPKRVLLGLGVALGSLGYALSARYRAVALKNMAIAYGDSISIDEKLRITRQVFINFAKAAVAEFAVTAKMSPEQIKQLCEVEPDALQKITDLLSRGKGIVAVSAHIGNFELMARRFAVDGYKFAVVVRNDGNQAIAGLLNEIRETSGYEVIGRGEAAKPILKKLRAGGIAVMLPDQKSDDVFVPFFGTLAGTVAGPAVVALRTGAPILPIFCIRLPGDRHKIIAGTPIEAIPTDDKEADTERIMTRVNEEIEKIVRQYPEQWLWLHDRWRVKVPAEVMAKWEATHQTMAAASAQPSAAS